MEKYEFRSRSKQIVRSHFLQNMSPKIPTTWKNPCFKCYMSSNKTFELRYKTVEYANYRGFDPGNFGAN